MELMSPLMSAALWVTRSLTTSFGERAPLPGLEKRGQILACSLSALAGALSRRYPFHALQEEPQES